jgi:hypothetical protein
MNQDSRITISLRLWRSDVEILKSMHKSKRPSTAANAIVERAIEEFQKAAKS